MPKTNNPLTARINDLVAFFNTSFEKMEEAIICHKLHESYALSFRTTCLHEFLSFLKVLYHKSLYLDDNTRLVIYNEYREDLEKHILRLLTPFLEENQGISEISRMYDSLFGLDYSNPAIKEAMKRLALSHQARFENSLLGVSSIEDLFALLILPGNFPHPVSPASKKVTKEDFLNPLLEPSYLVCASSEEMLLFDSKHYTKGSSLAFYRSYNALLGQHLRTLFKEGDCNKTLLFTATQPRWANLLIQRELVYSSYPSQL